MHVCLYYYGSSFPVALLRTLTTSGHGPYILHGVFTFQNLNTKVIDRPRIPLRRPLSRSPRPLVGTCVWGGRVGGYVSVSDRTSP